MTHFSFSRFSFSYSSFSCFYSFAFLYLAFILSVYSCFFFLYHLSLLLPRSYFLSIGSPIHPCFIFLPVAVPYNPTALQAHAAPVLSLCFPAFRSCCLTRSFSYLSAFLSVLRAFALPSSLLPPPDPLPGYKKSPPGVSAPGGDPLSLWVLSIALGLLLFPYCSCFVLCICSIRIALTFLFFLIALAQISGQTCLLLAVSAPSLRT